MAVARWKHGGEAMVAPAIPLIYWGIGILIAGGAAIAARRTIDEELEIGKIELPESITDLLDPQPQPEEREPEPEPQKPKNPYPRPPYDYDTETRARRRCQEDPEQDCELCKVLSEGQSTLPRHTFAAGTVQRPSPRARGSLYQHYVVGWFHYEASEDGEGNLEVQIEEWNWRLGVVQSWDGLVYTECKLLECKLGYLDFLDENDPNYAVENPKKRFLGKLEDQFMGQLGMQYAAMRPDWPDVSLEWVFSDEEVMWQFVALRTALSMNEVGNKHVPFHLSPSGTNYVREQYSDGSEDEYGYWEDS